MAVSINVRHKLRGQRKSAWGLTPVEQERIRVNAARYSAVTLAALMERSYDTITRWARDSGIEFLATRRYCSRGKYPARRQSPTPTVESAEVIDRLCAVSARLRRWAN